MNHPEIIMVMARATNGVIGVNGGLPWRLPDDLRHFKQITTGRPMIMGRATFDSLPGLLDGRRHIVLTRDANWSADGVQTANCVAQALALANAPHVCVIGGGQIWQQFLPLADRIELTDVHAQPDGDTHIDAPDPADWQETQRQCHAAANGRPAFDFVTYIRQRGA
ncbi:MAG: dihydrofolate reductase [Sphingopyxis sp.]